MAIVKQIVEANGLSRYNFLSSDRLRIEEHSHTSEEAGDGGVSQIFNLILADTQDNIRDAVVELEHRLTQAVYWHTQNMSTHSLWWNEQSEGESAKRSLITGFSLRPLTDDIQNPQVLEANGARYRCVITHRAEFEETTPDSYTTGTAVPMAGGEWTPGAGGGQATFDHRISHIKLTPSAQIEKWWIGILPKYYNTDSPTNFNPEAYFTNGTAVGSSDTTIIDDSANGAVGGAPNTARVTFATNATMISRAYKLLYDPSYSGEYARPLYRAGPLPPDQPNHNQRRLSHWHVVPHAQLEIFHGRLAADQIFWHVVQLLVIHIGRNRRDSNPADFLSLRYAGRASRFH
jgi:hypothetical protein